ncbi:translocation and assembly module TamB [Halopseudomonas xinjiangensis]|uniref:Translocation and assembly module TamB n=1 Tax=Halopseudomonas xinjiangensis TaxID=487184 RepID=A0A1H1QXI2_9GAMM|nr:translocation/assembly module TamB domain-containing protein [Halopseudomonas xinjiangensis]SDS27995.1 translocation and assembly module TamB [Halopseudomonas xinjiangensis]
MIWFFVKVLLRGLLILALIPIVLGLLLTSEGVNAWLIERIEGLEPRLQLDHTGGTLWEGFQFDRIVWQDDGIHVVVRDVSSDWETRCLADRRLCIEHIDIGSIVVQTDPEAVVEEEEPADEGQPVSLPDINLPIAIQLDRLRVGSLTLNEQDPLLNEVVLVARMRGDQLTVIEFVGQGPDLSWSLDGELRTSGDWPLMVKADVDAPPVNDQPLSASLRLGGSLERLAIDLRTRGYVDGSLEGIVQPLEPDLPVNLEWRGEPFLVLDTLPETLTLEEWQINAEGNLDQGIDVRATATLPGQGGDVRLALDALVQQTRLPELTLRLSVADAPERHLSLDAVAEWAETPSADATLLMEVFPWQWLYPVETGELDINRLEADASLRGEEFRAELTTSLTGVAGQPADITLTAQGTPEQVTVSNLYISTPAGSARGQAVVGLAEELNWDAQLQLENLDPGVFVADLPGRLNGPVSSTGRITDDGPRFEADWNLEGTLREQPLKLSGELQSEEGTFTVSDLILRQGPNRITGQGAWGERIAADLDIDLSNLATLWPGLTGTLQGTVNATGDPSEPTLVLQLDGNELGYADMGLGELTANGTVTLSETLPMDLTLQANRIRTGETWLGNLTLDLDGDKARHALDLDLSGGQLQADTTIVGSLDEETWQGALTAGELAFEDMVWRLAEDAGIRYQLQPGRLTLEGHCWAHESGRLCFDGQQQLLPDRDIDLAMANFPLSSLEQWLPEDFAWLGELDADIDFSQRAGGQPVANIVVSSRDGVITVSNPEQTLDFNYSNLELTSELDAGQARNRLLLSGETLGDLDVQANVDDPAGEQRLSGSFSLDGFSLNFLQPFLPQVATLEAELQGQGELGGTLTEPAVNGEIVLEDGLIAGPELPVSFEDLDLRVGIDGQTADINGNWRSGANGEGSLTGQVTWAPELNLSLTLAGSALPVIVAPYADLIVSPDLRVSLQENRLRVRGKIAVPEGNITIRELPEQAVRVSPDEVIVGEDEETVEDELPLEIDARVQLVIGDQLRFSGFGLTGRLSGRIQVDEELTANGDLNILNGRFRRFGQRLTLRRAQILFAGPISQPFLNIEAVREVDDVTAGLRLTGRAEAPQSEVFSEPAMPQEQALSYLILGRPLGSDSGDNNMLGQAALALGMAGSGPVTQNIAESLGIQNFQLETEGSGTETQVVAAGYLTDRLSVRYGVGVFEPANQLALRYDLSKRLYLEAVSGLASSLDFFYRIDF